MTRLTREMSQAVTRARLLAAARDLFGRNGYAATSVERISEEAGFSKGAVYSNFESKEAIFLAVLGAQGQESLDMLIAAIARAADLASLRALLVNWADDRSGSGGWALTIMEYARQTGAGSAAFAQQETILRDHWRQLGAAILARVPRLGIDPEALGALLHEIAYAPAMTFIDRPTAGNLMHLVLTKLLDVEMPENAD